MLEILDIFGGVFTIFRYNFKNLDLGWNRRQAMKIVVFDLCVHIKEGALTYHHTDAGIKWILN